MADMVRTQFVDMSFWQGNVDFSKVDPAIHGFFLKTSEADFYDKMYKTYVQGCKDNQKDDGSYHFFRGWVKGYKQAKLAIARVGDNKQELPYVLDFESTDGKDLVTLANEAKSYCDTIVNDTGTIPMIYTAKWFMDKFFWYRKYIEWMKDYPLWLAEYPWEKQKDFITNFSLYNQRAVSGEYFPKAIYPWSQVEMWQWTGHGRVVGLTGDVDMNVSAAEIIPAPPTPAPVLYQVTAWLGLRVRTYPEITSPVIGSVKYGTIVAISKIENGWGYSEMYRGWLSMQYLEKK
jgi:GH25 family lysozyme M1 (1,4-beta-N-acetylmuramidase)